MLQIQERREHDGYLKMVKCDNRPSDGKMGIADVGEKNAALVYFLSDNYAAK